MMCGANGKQLSLAVLFVAIVSYDFRLANGGIDFKPSTNVNNSVDAASTSDIDFNPSTSVSNSINYKPSSSSDPDIKGLIPQQLQTHITLVDDEQQAIKDEQQVLKGEQQVLKGEQQVLKDELQILKDELQLVKDELQLVKDKSKRPVIQIYNDDQNPHVTSKHVQQPKPSLTTQATAPPKQQTKQQDGGSIPQHGKSKTPVAQIYDDQKPHMSKHVQQTQPSLTRQSTPEQQTEQQPLTAGHKSKHQQKRQLYSLS
ncbi:uncharacterized protein LOC134455543 isoform X1 [Engraulis encrasicolus]|uniref:uncharacterized protein LOC134455543 isoform X1 n=1 Tax=Engraulis encrasicolus TaxID=184585 RepID=UPI002FD17E43